MTSPVLTIINCCFGWGFFIVFNFLFSLFFFIYFFGKHDKDLRKGWDFFLPNENKTLEVWKMPTVNTLNFQQQKKSSDSC